jgi:hypothetical protein
MNQVRNPPQPVSVLWPAPTLSPSFLLAQAIFEPDVFPYNTPTFSNLIHSSHQPAYEDGTECSETSAYNIQTSGNYPGESIQHSEHGESLKSRIVIAYITLRFWACKPANITEVFLDFPHYLQANCVIVTYSTTSQIPISLSFLNISPYLWKLCDVFETAVN